MTGHSADALAGVGALVPPLAVCLVVRRTVLLADVVDLPAGGPASLLVGCSVVHLVVVVLFPAISLDSLLAG